MPEQPGGESQNAAPAVTKPAETEVQENDGTSRGGPENVLPKPEGADSIVKEQAKSSEGPHTALAEAPAKAVGAQPAAPSETDPKPPLQPTVAGLPHSNEVNAAKEALRPSEPAKVLPPEPAKSPAPELAKPEPAKPPAQEPAKPVPEESQPQAAAPTALAQEPKQAQDAADLQTRTVPTEPIKPKANDTVSASVNRDAPVSKPDSVQEPQQPDTAFKAPIPTSSPTVPTSATQKQEPTVIQKPLQPAAPAVIQPQTAKLEDQKANNVEQPKPNPEVKAEQETLEKKVEEAKNVAEKAGEAAMAAVAQASALANAAAMPYQPPMTLPSHLRPVNTSNVADVQRLEQQAAAVEADVLRRRQAAMQQQQREEMERRQMAQHAPPQRPQPMYSRDRSPSPQEREMPPRRAASARAAKVFKKDADDYLSESPEESPPASPRPKKTPPKPKPPPQPPVAPKPALSKDSGASAWEEAPQQQMVLKMSDITKALQKKWLQLYWPDDGKWWPCQVVFVDPRKKTANVLYETGEEEADLALAELVEKGEVAWLNKADAHKEVTTQRGRYQDDYDDGAKGRKKAMYDDDEDDDEDEDDWGPGRKRRAAVKARAKYEESEAESSESESPPVSDQSSDWHSSEDEDKPAKKRPKKKRKPTRPAPRPQQQQSHHHHHPSQGRDRMGSHNDSHMANRNMMGRGGIFDDEPGFGGSFGGGMDSMRSQAQRNPSMGQGQMQQMGWAGIGGQQRSAAQMPGGWSREQMLQQQNRQQQMSNNNLGQLHIPQVSMQGSQGFDMGRYQQAAAAAQAQGMRGGMGWRPQPGQDSRQDWAALQNPMLRMQQMNQHAGQMAGQQNQGMQQLMHQQMLQQQQLQQQLAAQQRQQQIGQQAGPGTDAPIQRASMLGPATQNMEALVAQGMSMSGKNVEIQQGSDGRWVRGTIMATMARGGPQGGSALIHFDTGEQKQLAVGEEGRSYNIRLA